MRNSYITNPLVDQNYSVRLAIHITKCALMIIDLVASDLADMHIHH